MTKPRPPIKYNRQILHDILREHPEWMRQGMPVAEEYNRRTGQQLGRRYAAELMRYYFRAHIPDSEPRIEE